jgi:hypothetical protein
MPKRVFVLFAQANWRNDSKQGIVARSENIAMTTSHHLREAILPPF